MSVATWKKEFYDIPACAVLAEEALAHSLRKWVGLLPENLERHNCRLDERHVTDGQTYFSVDGDSCALCEHHYEDGLCSQCPLYQQLGFRCDSNDVDGTSPYMAFAEDHDPTPMITALVHTLANNT